MPFGQYTDEPGTSKWGSSSSSKSSGSTSKWGTSAPTATTKKPLVTNPFDTTSIVKQIDNAKVRINDAGGEINPDKRNFIEKGLNLPEGQNWFFDTLDVLGRPQQALYGAVDAGIKGADISEGAAAGFKGKQKLTGSDFVGQTGIKNKYLKAGLGFGLDVVADPVNLIPGAVIAKGVQKAGQGVKGAYNAAEKVIPGLEKAKDGLGNMFVPQYKWDETLTGGKNDFLKEKFNETENSIRYMGENSLNEVTKTAKQAGGVDVGDDVGRLMEKDVQVYGPRPSRTYSNDPKITDAANTLIKSNETLRQWALDNGVQVGEIDGYMRHILSAEERALKKSKTGKVVDRPQSGLNNPDKKILNARKLQGSAEDINDEIGRKFFDPNAFFSTAIGQKKLVDYGNAVKFRREVLSNPDFAKPFTKGMVKTDGTEIINTNNYKFLTDPHGILPNDIGGEYMVTKGVKQALDRYSKLTTDEGINAFLKTYDKGLSMWKRATLLSVPYHVRNDIGAKFNNFVSGMGAHQIAKYSTLADKDVYNAMVKGKETPMFNEFRQQGLSSSSQLAVEFARRGDEPEEAISKIVKDQSKTGLKKAADIVNPLKVFQNSQNMGSFIDQTNRFALYRWARETKKMTPEQAADKVRAVQFDYGKLTPAEKEIFTRVIPFYRWSRNNIPFQLRTFAENPKRYMAVNKLRMNLQDSMGIDEENMPGYMKENLYFPYSGDGKGSGMMASVNLPAGDLTKLSNPGKLGLDSLTPLAKLPIELTSNRNLFFNNDIQRFEGQQKKYRIPEKIYGVNIPGGGKELGGLPVKTAYAAEQIGGQPVRGLSKILAKPTVQDQENVSLKPSLGISALRKKYDVNETNYRQKQAELRELMDYIDYLEQEQGQRARSVTEIKKGR